MTATITIPRPGAGLLGLARRVTPPGPPPPPPPPRPPPVRIPPPPPPAEEPARPARPAAAPLRSLPPAQTEVRPRRRGSLPSRASREEEAELLGVASEREAVLLAVWFLSRREGATGPHALEEVAELLARHGRTPTRASIGARVSHLATAGLLERVEWGSGTVRITASGITRARTARTVADLSAEARRATTRVAAALERAAQGDSARVRRIRSLAESLGRTLAELEALA